MKPSITATEALKNTPVIRTDGDINNVLSNTLLALVRKEMSATDALAIVAVTDGMCNVMNTGIKYSRLKLDAQRAAGEKVKLVNMGRILIAGDSEDDGGQEE